MVSDPTCGRQVQHAGPRFPCHQSVQNTSLLTEVNFRGAEVVHAGGQSPLGAPRDVGGVPNLEVGVHADEHFRRGHLVPRPRPPNK